MQFKAPNDISFVIVDPSLRSSGVLVCKNGEIRTYAIQRKEDRLAALGWYIKHFAKLAKDAPWDFMAIEDYAFSSNSRSVTVQGEIGGIIRACFASFLVPILEIPISTWKAVTGIKLKKTSVEEKREYRNAVAEKFGIEADTTDECDAYLMMYTIAQISRGKTINGQGASIRTELEKLKIRI